MRGVEERVAYLKGQANRLDVILEAMRHEFAANRADFAAVRGEISQMGNRLDSRIDRLEDRMGRQFIWLVGVQITMWLAVVGALLARA